MRCVLLSSLVSLTLASCGKSSKQNAAAERNKRCADAIADGKVTEARTWLDTPGTQGFEVEKRRMREVADAFYAAGATKVSAAWDEHDGAQISALLVVDLPAGAARAKVFDQYTALAPSFELDAETDVGQTCLLVAFD